MRFSPPETTSTLLSAFSNFQKERAVRERLSDLLGIPEGALQFPSIPAPRPSPIPSSIFSRSFSSFSSNPNPFQASISLPIDPPSPPRNPAIPSHHFPAIPPLRTTPVHLNSPETPTVNPTQPTPEFPSLQSTASSQTPPKDSPDHYLPRAPDIKPGHPPQTKNSTTNTCLLH